MPKSRKNSSREERIDYEIVVDAYGPEERAMGWYYYLEDKLCFPFRAKCTVSQVVSPLKKGETVEFCDLHQKRPVPATCSSSSAGTTKSCGPVVAADRG